MFTPDLDLKVITRCSKFSIQDKTGIDTGDGTKWYADGTGLDPSTLSSVVVRVITPSGTETDYELIADVPNPVTGSWWYSDVTGSGEDGLHDLVYRLQVTTPINILAFADYNNTVNGTVAVTSITHGLITGMYVVISGTTNYDGEYYVTKIDDNTFYITAEFAGDDATGSGTIMHQSTFYPYVYCNAEARVDKLYAIISRLPKGSARDQYLEDARTAFGLLGSLKSAISSVNITAADLILAEITHILSFYDLNGTL